MASWDILFNWCLKKMTNSGISLSFLFFSRNSTLYFCKRIFYCLLFFYFTNTLDYQVFHIYIFCLFRLLCCAVVWSFVLLTSYIYFVVNLSLIEKSEKGGLETKTLEQRMEIAKCLNFNSGCSLKTLKEMKKNVKPDRYVNLRSSCFTYGHYLTQMLPK